MTMHGRWVSLLLLCWVVALAGAEGVGGIHLERGQELPRELGNTWTRLIDGAQIDVHHLTDLEPGAYLAGDRRVFIRDGEGPAARARSLVGTRIIERDELSRREALAETGEAFDHLTLVAAVWRLSDGRRWPWPPLDGQGGRFSGLAWLSTRREGAPWTFAEGLWRGADGEPVRIGHEVEVGDLLSASAADDRFPSVGILVADRGLPGFLDPEDLVVTALDAAVADTLAERVQVLRLGELLGGPLELHAFRADPERLQARRALRADNPIWELPTWRQNFALAGMVLVCLALLRLGRRRRRKG